MVYYIELIFSIFAFIMGMMFGSFFTLAIYRIPRHQDIVKTRSYCPTCKHKLGFFDCFPILSYVSTIGRCRYCKKPISIRYPLIEFASGLVFLLIYLIFGLSWRALIMVICYVYLFLVIGVDIMKSKMTEEEKKEVEKLVKDKKESKKKRSKSGAINVDILIAVIVFSLFFVSTIFITRNYNLALVEYTRKSNALNICVNSINEAKYEEVEDLQDSTKSYEIDGVTYTGKIEVLPYLVDNVESDKAKVIVSTVTYNNNGVMQEITLKYIKVV